MVRIEDYRNNLQCKRQSDERDGGEFGSSSNNEIYGKKSRKDGIFSYIREKTKEILMDKYPCPIQAIRDLPEFRNDLILCNPKNKDYYVAALDNFQLELMNYSLRQFYDMLKDKQKIFFSSFDYGTIEESIIWIDELLRFQFDEDLESIQHFLNSLVDVLDKRLPKLNTLCVKSQPSAGKNFFFDMIFAIVQNYGQFGSANKNNNFAFMEAPNRRVILWNEPNYESALTELIKLILGGDPYTVRVKNQPDQHVKRTPVIVLTNNHVNFMHEIAFNDRIVKFNWKPAPFLKEIDCKPYPLTFFEILKKYNINF